QPFCFSLHRKVLSRLSFSLSSLAGCDSPEISLNPFIALRDGSYPDSPSVSLIPDSHGSSPHTIIPTSSEGAEFDRFRAKRC
ncbi:unnamed protein product, partial [Arabidopsis halleri]